MASKIIEFAVEKITLGYDIVGDGAEILFLHGWGSNRELMKKAFAPYFAGFRLIFVDMPGFGESDEPSVAFVTSDYEKIIREFTRAANLSPVAIVGHSFGGKVASLMKPDLLVLLSSAGIVTKKKLWTRVKIIAFKILKLIGLGRFYGLFATKDVAGMSRVMYETLKNVVNEDFSGIFARIKSRALIFWGNEDTTTPISSGKKIANLMENSEFFGLEGGHFFFMTNGEFIANIIKENLQKISCENVNSDVNSDLNSNSRMNSDVKNEREFTENECEFDDETSFCPCCEGKR